MDAELLGLLILAEFPADNGPRVIHLGYLLGETAWGRGLATELISGLVSALRNLGEPIQLLGGVENANPASARVLVKNGFQLVERQSTHTTKMYELRISV